MCEIMVHFSSAAGTMMHCVKGVESETHVNRFCSTHITRNKFRRNLPYNGVQDKMLTVSNAFGKHSKRQNVPTGRVTTVTGISSPYSLLFFFFF